MVCTSLQLPALLGKIKHLQKVKLRIASVDYYVWAHFARRPKYRFCNFGRLGVSLLLGIPQKKIFVEAETFFFYFMYATF